MFPSKDIDVFELESEFSVQAFWIELSSEDTVLVSETTKNVLFAFGAVRVT